METQHGAQRVIVADDEAELRETVEELLEGNGYLAIGAVDGQQALTKMRSGEVPSLAIIDLTMPRKSGREVIAEMRADPLLRQVPVIAVSGEALQALEGAEVILRKPYSAHQLLDAVHQLISRSGFSKN